MHPHYTPEQIARFWSHVDISPGPDACWPWIKACNAMGYGTLGIGAKHWLAHRLAWTLTNGAIPAGLYVLHRCDNPPCCNPAHLWLGTLYDNNADKKAKARGAGPRGETQHAARLTAEAVRVIRRRYAVGDVTQKVLADEFGVTAGVIGAVVNYRSWRHIDPQSATALRRHGKLQPAQVRAIRALYTGGAAITVLAQACNVATNTIARIIERRTWQHLDGDEDEVECLADHTARGERQGAAKLTEPQVREIRQRYAAGGVSQNTLAEQYGVARSLIWAIVTRRLWRHLEP